MKVRLDRRVPACFSRLRTPCDHIWSEERSVFDFGQWEESGEEAAMLFQVSAGVSRSVNVAQVVDDRSPVTC